MSVYKVMLFVTDHLLRHCSAALKPQSVLQIMIKGTQSFLF